MRPFWAAVAALALVAGSLPDDAEARRLGGARSLGAQRQLAAPQKPAAAPQQAQTPAQAPPAGMSRWLAPLAALAAGLGLAALFGAQAGTLIVALLLAVAAVLLVRLVVRSLLPGAAPRSDPVQYAGLGHETVAAPPPSQLPALSPVAGVGRSVPAGFDVTGFLRQARQNFIALQEAHDRGDLEAIRNFVTEEMFAALARDAAAQRASGGRTDVVTLDANLLEVTTEAGTHWASIRFSGMLREERDGAPMPFEEIWNLRKPEKGRSGWLLAGIEQVS